MRKLANPESAAPPATLGFVENIGKHIYSRECQQPLERNTKRWTIVAHDGEVELGEVKWFGKWRCYAYFPLNDTLYEKQCLRDIAAFCERRTNEHRDYLKQGNKGE
jgi:hypothetical protein